MGNRPGNSFKPTGHLSFLLQNAVARTEFKKSPLNPHFLGFIEIKNKTILFHYQNLMIDLTLHDDYLNYLKVQNFIHITFPCMSTK